MLRALSARCQPKEQQSVPAGAGRSAGNGTEGTVVLALVFETVLEHFHSHGFISIFPTQNRAGDREAPVLAFGRTGGSLPLNPGGGHLGPQLRIIGNGESSFPGTLGEIAIGQGLQPPSNPANQMLLVLAAGLMAEYFSITLL